MNEKLWRENRKGYFFGVCLGPRCFLPEPTKKFSPKWRENWEEEAHEMSFQKYPSHWNSPSKSPTCWLFFFPLIFSFLVTNVLASFFLFLFSFEFFFLCY